MVNAEFFDALEQLEKEKGIPVDYMLDRVGQALITAYKRDNDGMTDNVYVEPDRDKKTIHMFVRKTVVKAEDLYEPYEEITLEEAAEYKNNPMVGDIIDIDIPTKSFGRIAAQTAKQVIIQGIREAERGMVISEFESKEHEILNGVVARIDPRSGTAYLDVVSGGEKSEAVLAASEQLLDVVNETLEISRMEAGHVQLAEAECSLSELVLQARMDMVDLADRADVTLACDIEPLAHDRVLVDAVRLSHVLTQLVDNAIKYSAPGGRITVKLWAGEYKAFAEIIDQGRGIPPEDLENVKTKFYKGSNSVRGSGIGLALVDSIMTALDGTMDLKSTLGRGTVVTLGLPIYKR